MKHGRYCFCTDCCEARQDTPEDFPDYDEWKRAFPGLPWENGTEMKAIPGNWYLETDKGVKLYCVSVDADRVNLAYRPGDPIAVVPTHDIFNSFFKPTEAP